MLLLSFADAFPLTAWDLTVAGGKLLPTLSITHAMMDGQLVMFSGSAHS